jgi:hypothetical protein
MEPTRKFDEETFWRKLILPEEEKLRLDPGHRWQGGFRWFRSPNIIPIERWRRKQAQSTPATPAPSSPAKSA